MYCEKCGVLNDDSAKFCESCGAELSAVEVIGEEGAEFTQVVSATPNNNLVGTILKIAIPVVAVVLVFVILLSVGLFKSAEKKAIEKYFNAIIEGDGKTLYSLQVDPYEMKNMLDSDYNDYESEKDIIEEWEEDAEENLEYLEDEYGDKLKVSVEIKDVKKYSKDDIKALNEYIFDNYDETYDDKNVLQDIRLVKVRATIEGSDDHESDSEEMVVYKLKGKWYVNGIAGLYDKHSIKEAIKSVEE